MGKRTQMARLTRFPLIFIFFCKNAAWQWDETKQPTCMVVICLSLNVFWQYRSTSEVLPTQPSPSKTTLKECTSAMMNGDVNRFSMTHFIDSRYLGLIWDRNSLRCLHEIELKRLFILLVQKCVHATLCLVLGRLMSRLLYSLLWNGGLSFSCRCDWRVEETYHRSFKYTTISIV